MKVKKSNRQEMPNTLGSRIRQSSLEKKTNARYLTRSRSKEFQLMLANNDDTMASVTSNSFCDDVVMDNNVENNAMIINTTQSLHTHFNGIEAAKQIQDTVEQRDAVDGIMISETMRRTLNNFDGTSGNVHEENSFGNNRLRYTFSASSLTSDIDLADFSCFFLPDAAFGPPLDFPGIKKDDKESAVYIPHQYATDDPKLGDRFGVNIWTDTSSEKDGYYRHFFQKVEEGGPAYNMEIRNNDEIVLIDGHFVPYLNHERIMELFVRISVDGSRLELILRRKYTTWEWFQTSAILVPELNEEPKITKVQYNPLSANSYDTNTWQRYRLSGTQLFLTIDSSGMGADIIRGKPHDRSKLIQKHSRVCEDQHNKIVFMASLRCADEAYFAMIDMQGSVVTTTEEKFFQFQNDGTGIFFKQDDLYLNCEDKTVSASQKKQMFEEWTMSDHKDMVDGQDDGYESGSPPGTLAKRVTRSMSRQPSVTTQCRMSFECFAPFRKAPFSS